MMASPTVPDGAPAVANMENGEGNLFADRMRPTEIARFSPVAARIIPKIMHYWSVSDEDGARLLSVSSTEWNEMKTEDWKGLLSQAQLERASLLINIFSEIRQLYPSQEAADGWVSGVIHAAPFEGKRPLDLMLAGSSDLLRVRCWVMEAAAVC